MIFYSDSARVHRGRLTTTFSTASVNRRREGKPFPILCEPGLAAILRGLSHGR
jgi:hypothetical protein